MEYKKKVTTLDVATKKTNKSVPEQPIEDGIKTAELAIPFHAIDHVDVTSELQTITRPDPYGCDGGDAPKPAIYGAIWDGSGSTKWLRTDASESFEDPEPAIANGTGSSPFDNIMPWKGMKKIEDEEAGTLVAIPKYWYKWTKEGSSMHLQIANYPEEGFFVSPAHADRDDGMGERDTVYVGRYHCSETDYKSTSGVLPKVSMTRANFRTNIHALGSTVWQYDFAMYWTIAMLYLVEFADWNSQACIGYGCGTTTSVINEGATDAMQYHTGTNAPSRDSYGEVQYRNIEGLWSGLYTFVDGVYFADTAVFVIKKPEDFSDTSNGVWVNTRASKSGVPTAFGTPLAGFEYALYPSSVSGTDYTVRICDKCGYYSQGTVLITGSTSEYHEQTDGLFFMNGSDPTSYTGSRCGSRLQKLS